MAEAKIEYPVWMEETAHTVDGKLWVKGNGSIPSEYLFIGEKPGDKEARTKRVFSGPSGELLFNRLTMLGFNLNSYYMTNAVKYPLPRNKNVTAKDLKVCKPMLDEEISRTNPKVIVCLGANALHAVVGRNVGLTQVRGEFIPHPTLACRVFGMYNPAYVLRNPEAMGAFDRDVIELVRDQQGGADNRDTVTFEPVITTVAGVRAFGEQLFATQANPFLVLDMEWHGKTWMDPLRFLRTIQLGYAHGKAAIIEVRDVGGTPVIDDEPGMFVALKKILEDPRVGICGHSSIADGEWLLSYGIDIRPRVIWDTMLAEYLLHETGPWDLGEVALKYTNYHRYKLPVEMWVKSHEAECRHGYGFIPRDMLLPYGAIDVDAPRKITEKQIPLIAKDFMQPRGKYPSLWDTTLRTQEIIYELQRTGMLVDKDRLKQLIDAYQGARSQLLGLVTTESAAIGFANFNPASVDDVRSLLFKYLQLPPVKTTAGKAWVDQVGNQGMDDDTEQRASTDKTTLEILQDANPIVKHLLQFRRIDTACKNLLRWPKEDEDEASKGGGIPAKIWPDGRLHARFSQLAETGRFRHSKPNVANWPKKAEGYMVEIFGGKDKVPPSIRSIIVPEPGYVLMEGDFSQAELFVLAALSGDRNMMEALSTPGRDLHDMTAITAFGLKVLGPDGSLVPDDYMVRLAAQYGAKSKEFKGFQKQLRYLDQKGKIMTRDEFSDTLRVSAKNLEVGLTPLLGSLHSNVQKQTPLIRRTPCRKRDGPTPS